jgi:hypothetical protein
VLGRVKYSSSHDSILFAFFAGDKDARAEARCESFQEKGEIGARVIKKTKLEAKWNEKLLETEFLRQIFVLDMQ